MPTKREAVAAYREALTAAGASEFRRPTTTDFAVELAKELTSDEIRHAEPLAAALSLIEALPAAPTSTEFQEWQAHIELHRLPYEKFWDAFEGQVVEGVEIIRKR